MKDFITKLQTETPKAWAKVEQKFEKRNLKITMGYLHFKLLSIGKAEDCFDLLEGVFNSVIESEGYYLKLDRDRYPDEYRKFVVYVVFDYDAKIYSSGKGRTILEAKQSAIEEAFKLIEAKL